MALGKRKRAQQAAWMATTDLPKSPGHPFYKKLNKLLAEGGFDEWLETLCVPYYSADSGRDSIPPGVYFRMNLVGYFEGIGSQRGIAWLYPADQGDSETLAESVVQAQKNVINAESPANIAEVVADKGYHAAETLALVNEMLGVRIYIPEPQRKKPWKWREPSTAERCAVTANHRRVRGARSKTLQRRRSELVERSFAHVCQTGGARRCWLHDLLKVSKRYLLQVAARNLGLIMRKLFGMGTPRGLQKGGGAASLAYLLTPTLCRALWTTWKLVMVFRNKARTNEPRLRVLATAI
jgi:hypothetical protein